MATFLDITLLKGAKVIFTFLLVYVIVWGLLVWIKPFGKDVPTGPYAIIGLVAAFFSVISPSVNYLIGFVTPWFLFLVIFLFFVLFILRMFNVSEVDLRTIIGQGSVHIMILVLIFIIMLFGLGSTFGQKSLEATQGETGGGVYYQGPDAFENVPVEGGDTTSGVLRPVEPLVPGQDLSNPGYAGKPQPGQPGATATSDFSLNLVNTLLHPRVLAIIAVLLIGTITVWMLGRPDFI